MLYKPLWSFWNRKMMRWRWRWRWSSWPPSLPNLSKRQRLKSWQMQTRGVFINSCCLWWKSPISSFRSSAAIQAEIGSPHHTSHLPPGTTTLSSELPAPVNHREAHETWTLGQPSHSAICTYLRYILYLRPFGFLFSLPQKSAWQNWARAQRAMGEARIKLSVFN